MVFSNFQARRAESAAVRDEATVSTCCRLNSTMGDTEDIDLVAIEKQLFLNKWKHIVLERVFPPDFKTL